MAEPVRISLDVMGGDNGAEVVLEGAHISLKRHPNIEYLLYGIESEIMPILERYPEVQAASTVIDCEISITMDEKPSQALRKGRGKSSMWKAIEATKTGEADACISAGNTGALMAMALFCLRTQPGIDRPAMAGFWPTLRGESIVLDLGANIGAESYQLIDFAIMGAAMARAVFNVEKPTVGLLNIGVEEVKGQESVKIAGQMLNEANLDQLEYKGFVEGTDLGKGTVDVVVTEGYSGNIALKTAEGTARQIAEYLRQGLSRTWLTKLGYILAKGAFVRLREKMDPRKVNGAVMLGLNGAVIKSHGGTDGIGYASAIDLGYDIAKKELMKKISHDIEEFEQTRIAFEGDTN
jgi:glycerol-3-phosphate acyltransferase PlsX